MTFLAEYLTFPKNQTTFEIVVGSVLICVSLTELTNIPSRWDLDCFITNCSINILSLPGHFLNANYLLETIIIRTDE